MDPPAAAKMKATATASLLLTLIIAFGCSSTEINATRTIEEVIAMSRELKEEAKKAEEEVAALQFGPLAYVPESFPVYLSKFRPPKFKPKPKQTEPEPEPEPEYKQTEPAVEELTVAVAPVEPVEELEPVPVVTVPVTPELTPPPPPPPPEVKVTPPSPVTPVTNFEWSDRESESESGESESPPPPVIMNETKEKLLEIIERLTSDVSKTLKKNTDTAQPRKDLMNILHHIKEVYTSDGGRLSELAVHLGKARQLKSLWNQIENPSLTDSTVNFQLGGTLQERLRNHIGLMASFFDDGNFGQALTGLTILKDCFESFMTRKEVKTRSSASRVIIYNVSSRRCYYAHLGKRNLDSYPVRFHKHKADFLLRSKPHDKAKTLPAKVQQYADAFYCEICPVIGKIDYLDTDEYNIEWGEDFYTFTKNRVRPNRDLENWIEGYEELSYAHTVKKKFNQRGRKSFFNPASPGEHTMADPARWSGNGAGMFVAILLAAVVFFVVLSMLRLLRWRRSLQGDCLERNSSTK